MIYLNLEEKKTLCNIIHKILTSYGGYWINADIYRKKEGKKRIDRFYKQKDLKFREKNKIEENKFITLADAKDFFSRCGFEIYKKIEIDKKELSSNKLLNEKNYSSTKVVKDENPRETWILKPN